MAGHSAQLLPAHVLSFRACAQPSCPIQRHQHQQIVSSRKLSIQPMEPWTSSRHREMARQSAPLWKRRNMANRQHSQVVQWFQSRTAERSRLQKRSWNGLYAFWKTFCCRTIRTIWTHRKPLGKHQSAPRQSRKTKWYHNKRRLFAHHRAFFRLSQHPTLPPVSTHHAPPCKQQWR